jgi:hypothetical protein
VGVVIGDALSNKKYVKRALVSAHLHASAGKVQVGTIEMGESACK